jgi:hypothetical protein
LGEILYEEGGRKYFFRVDFGASPVKLFVATYYTGPVSGVSYSLSDGVRGRIVSELVARLENSGYYVDIVD